MKHSILWLLTSRYGSNNISRYIRRILEKISIRELIGVNLASLSFVMVFIVPQTQQATAAMRVYFDTQKTTIHGVVVDSQFRWPLPTFGISQTFHGGHLGLDLQADYGTPVYPVHEGTVAWTSILSLGYGKHILIKNTNEITSLYGHLSKINVKEGDVVTKTTKIGEVGSTGWSTGNHVHLEIHQNDIPVNPMEILPELKSIL
ncbi:MAG: M23 family metallopeptidase [Patescibacteria group bacterium]